MSGGDKSPEINDEVRRMKTEKQKLLAKKDAGSDIPTCSNLKGELSPTFLFISRAVSVCVSVDKKRRNKILDSV